MVTRRPQHWSPGLRFGAFCTIFRARPVGAGLGAKFGREVTENGREQKNKLPGWIATKDIETAEWSSSPPSEEAPAQQQRETGRRPGPGHWNGARPIIVTFSAWLHFVKDDDQFKSIRIS